MDRVRGAGELRRLRESRGWSWMDLARALHKAAEDLSITALADCQIASLQRNVARWESGHGRPSERYQLLLAHLYRADLPKLLSALANLGVEEQRLHDLIELTAKVDHTRGEASIGELAAVIHRVNARIGSVPFVRLQLELAPVVEQLRRLSSTEPLAVTAFSIAARLAFETRDDAASAQLYAEAAATAASLADRSLRAATQTSHAMVALHSGNTNLARELVAVAVRDAHAGSSWDTRARAHAVHAEICARAGEQRAAAKALDHAWKAVDQSFDEQRLDGFQAIYELHTGNASGAHDRLARSVVALNGPRDVVQLGINTADLALARLRLGDPAACAALLHDVVDVVARTGGRVPGQRVRQVRRELRPWRAEAFVAELDDHMHDSLIGR